MKPLHEYTTEELKNMLLITSRQVGKTYLQQMIFKELLHRTFYPTKPKIVNE